MRGPPGLATKVCPRVPVPGNVLLGVKRSMNKWVSREKCPKSLQDRQQAVYPLCRKGAAIVVLVNHKGTHDWRYPLLLTEKVLVNCWSHVQYPDATHARRRKIQRAANSGLDRGRLALR